MEHKDKLRLAVAAAVQVRDGMSVMQVAASNVEALQEKMLEAGIEEYLRLGRGR